MNKSKIFRLCIIFVLIAVLIPVGISNYIKFKSYKKMVANPQGEFDTILVLGAGVLPNGQPSPMLKDRLEKGIELYEKGISGKLLLSGDHGQKHYDEVNVMKDYCLKRGVKKEDIFMDHAGFNTYDSVYRAKHVFQCNRIVIVTQRYHLYRALYLSDKIGLEAEGVSCDVKRYIGQFQRDIREILARNKAFIMGFSGGRTLLGDTIPIDGDGSVTHD
ncbi:MAG: DUF218 domain-containing protein [Tissierellia bacterium]|nr:DUF218 domain-containing protein [Tissierellia bacterium]